MNAGSVGIEPEIARGDRGGATDAHANRPTASTTMSMSRARSIETPTSALTGRPDRPSSSATVRPRVWRPGRLDVDPQRSRDDQVRDRQPGDRDGVVDRRSVPPVAVAMVDREEAHQVGEDPPRSRAEPLEPGDVRRQHERLVGDVEAGHPERDPRLEDDRGSLRVGPDVELGGGRGVARPERAAHQRDPGDPGAQRRAPPAAAARRSSAAPSRRASSAPRAARRMRRHQLDRRHIQRPDRRFRQVGAVETRIAVELDRDPRRRAPAAGRRRPRRARPCARARSGHGARFESSDRAARCPATVVIASNLSSGRASARTIARASSWPGSQSRMIGMVATGRSVAQPFHEATGAASHVAACRLDARGR